MGPFGFCVSVRDEFIRFNLQLFRLTLQMSYITFSPNEAVYIRGIGYATLINCGSRNTISQKVEALPTKKQSIYFDPDLFNSDIDSNNSKKSHSKSDEDKVEPKIPEAVEAKKSQDELKTKIQKVEKKQEAGEINIVQAKLEGSSAVIYASQQHLSKSIYIVVKSLLINHKEQIIIEIEISKTIDTLRKAIFQQFGEQISSYYNIKLFATNPMLNELSVHTKTIYQYLIKDNDKLILTADYAFNFKPLPAISCRTKITLNNTTLASTKPPEEPKPIALPPPPPPPTVPPPAEADGQVKVQLPPPPPKIEEIVQPPKSEIVPVPPIEDKVPQNQFYHARCNVQITSGRKYWEIKVDKLPADQNDLLIGVCLPFEQKMGDSVESCNHIWSYLVLSGKKGYLSHDQKGNIVEDEVQNYGYSVKQNDIVGVFVSIKGKLASLTFYKNSISCGQAYSIDLGEVGQRPLVPFVNIGGEAQVTLDSKAQLPLDSFRKK